MLCFSKSQVMTQMLALTVMINTVGAVSNDTVLPDLDVPEAVAKLVSKHGFEGESSEFEAGYKAELNHMLSRRLQLINDSDEIQNIRNRHPVVSMRMILENKKDGRKKGRLVLQGFKEPPEWDTMSNASPVAFTSTIRLLLFGKGVPEDVISSIDVSVAFLQADEYSEDAPPRYVSYKPYAGARDYLFKLRGPVYGQRSAPRAWYETIRGWMVSEMGYKQCKNDRCLFVHPKTGHRVALYVDDFLCRGSKGDSDRFYEALMSKFDCKDPTFLNSDQDIIFTGMTISREIKNGRPVNTMSQSNEIESFLKLKGIWDVRKVDSPMPDRSPMLGGDAVSDNMKSWCKSVIGGLQHFVRGTMWDIAHAVSRLGQQLANPDTGTVKQIDRIAGYLKSSIDRRLQGYHGVVMMN